MVRVGSASSAVALFVGIALLAGCSFPVTVPPITKQPTGTYHPGRFVWMDLVTADVDSARNFYGELFGWQYEGGVGKKVPFTLITQNGTPIGGIIYSDQMEPSKAQARWLAYISVPDVDKAAERVLQNGGDLFKGPFDLPDRGRVAIVLDPQKVPIALLRAGTGDPSYEKVTPYRWMWNELWTSDTASAMRFYADVVGYTREAASLTVQRDPYTVLMSDGRAQAGMAQLAREGVRPIWLPYVNVEDPRAIAAKALTLGGKVMVPPDSALRGGTVAVIADPTGGIVAIQKWTPQDSLDRK
jgi:predicted enzyme related to lactoylglutathione lyase